MLRICLCWLCDFIFYFFSIQYFSTALNLYFSVICFSPIWLLLYRHCKSRCNRKHVFTQICVHVVSCRSLATRKRLYTVQCTNKGSNAYLKPTLTHTHTHCPTLKVLTALWRWIHYNALREACHANVALLSSVHVFLWAVCLSPRFPATVLSLRKKVKKTKKDTCQCISGYCWYISVKNDLVLLSVFLEMFKL